jgi:hypothetical protein
MLATVAAVLAWWQLVVAVGAAAPGPMEVGPLVVGLSNAGTLTSLKLAGSAGADGFTFTSSGIGDATLRLRSGKTAAWVEWKTVGGAPLVPHAGAAFDLTNVTLQMVATTAIAPSSPTSPPTAPLTMVRSWEKGTKGTLVMRFRLTNPGSSAVEVGGFGATMYGVQLCFSHRIMLSEDYVLSTCI